MKELKKLLCIILTLIIALSIQPLAFAKEVDTTLKFDKNGELTILHLTDWHCDYPLPDVHRQLVLESISEAEPDLIVLGGDLSEAAHEDQPAAIKDICDLIVGTKVPFVITFGNHDYNHDYTIDEMFAFYRKYGGEYFIGVDEKPELFGCGTCSIPVYSNDGSSVAYNIYCFDSGDRTVENGEDKGYDCVHPDQIEWYKNKAEALKEANKGKYVPSVVFQHIIVQEIYDKLFPETDKRDTIGIMEYEGMAYDLKPIPNLSNIQSGYTFEHPCPGYHNYGELDAMSTNGDVRAIFCGHDHYNSFTVEINGINISNTPSIKPHILLRKINWGPRVITLHEDGNCESRVLMACELAKKENSKLTEVGAVNGVEIFIVDCWKTLVDYSLRFWMKIADIIYDF